MTSHSNPLYALIAAHIQRYPVLEVTDIYKLLHQSAFGAGYRVPSRKHAREWLDHEAGIADEPPATALLESVHPEEAFVRLHLTPYLAQGGNLAGLLDAYIRSSEHESGSAAAMDARWSVFEAMVQADPAWQRLFSLRQIGMLRAAHRTDDWAAVHHSPAFIQTYRPTYRILSVDEARTVCRESGVPFNVV